jgi:glycosyltransferase involved in cell wall biosynthesis
LVSDIGGMAEKVRHGVDGLHVPAANPRAWADALLRAAEDEPLWDRLRAGIQRPLSHDECAARHLETVLVR